jgi:aryl-alcohol dehydrogenase-like predicted oxidoreductase
MKYRNLGRTGIKVSPYALGALMFATQVGNPDPEDSIRIIHKALDAGINLVDTADSYGDSEEIVGRALKGRRDHVVLATKVGRPTGTDPNQQGASRRWIIAAVEDSLRRLQTDHIDLYQSHRDDPETPLGETLATYDALVKEGKVRVIGASNYNAARLGEALAVSAKQGVPRYESLQPEYNLYERAGYEAELEPLCRKNEVGVIGYYSLASGFLSGKYRSAADAGKSVRGKNIAAKYLNDRGLGILKALDDVSERLHATPAQVALAWLIARPGVTAPIASATTLDQLKELTGAVRLRLDPAAIQQLDRASG